MAKKDLSKNLHKAKTNKKDKDHLKVELIEQEFKRLMFNE
jgi:hypothetical protein